LTTFDGDDDIYRGVHAGAKSYLLKDVCREELFHCIREVQAGRTAFPSSIMAKLAERIPGEELSPRELEVLNHLAAGKPNKLIAAALFISEVTLVRHVQPLFRKLNAPAPDRGYRGGPIGEVYFAANRSVAVACRCKQWLLLL
jgi:DNA-binding NarL/FixJ family response regulator